jgi:glycogen operon protein
MSETLIYELHVKATTPTQLRRPLPRHICRAGLQDSLLAEPGVTAVELLPVQQFDEQDVMRRNPPPAIPSRKYWGYAPVGYFAPHLSTRAADDDHLATNEFRDMVKALHRAGIEVS